MSPPFNCLVKTRGCSHQKADVFGIFRHWNLGSLKDLKRFHQLSFLGDVLSWLGCCLRVLHRKEVDYLIEWHLTQHALAQKSHRKPIDAPNNNYKQSPTNLTDKQQILQPQTITNKSYIILHHKSRSPEAPAIQPSALLVSSLKAKVTLLVAFCLLLFEARRI